MKKFEEFIEKEIIRKQTPNKKRALSILKEVKKKKDFLELTLKTISREKMSPNFIADTCYDTLIELIRAKMFIDGYNAGNSHEAEVSYLRKIGFSEPEVIFMDDLRYYRNGTKYYGTLLTEIYAMQALDFMNKNYPKLLKLIV